MRRCAMCGKEIPKERTKYCSHQCYEQAHQQQIIEAKRRKEQMRRAGGEKQNVTIKRDSLEQKVYDALQMGMLYSDYQRMQYGYRPLRGKEKEHEEKD